MLRRDAPLQLVGGEGLGFAVHARRHQQVDAVGLAAHVVVDPGELHVERLRRVPDRAENAEAAGVRDRRHHVPAVAEGDQRELAAEHVADG